MMIISLTTAMLFLVSGISGEEQCPPELCDEEECFCSVDTIIMHGFLPAARLEGIIQNMPETLRKVIFHYRDKVLDGAIFKGKKDLLAIRSDGRHEEPQATNFTTIKRDAFKDLFDLKELQLKRYGLKTVAKEAFQGLISVRHIDLSGNSFTQMHPLQEMYAYIPRSSKVIYTGSKFKCTCEDWEHIRWAQIYRKHMFKGLKCYNLGRKNGVSIYRVKYSYICSGSGIFNGSALLSVFLTILISISSY